MTRRVVQVRCHDAERGLWVAAAGTAGVSLSVWVRRALNEQVEMERSLEREAANALGGGRDLERRVVRPLPRGGSDGRG